MLLFVLCKICINNNNNNNNSMLCLALTKLLVKVDIFGLDVADLLR